MPLNLDNCPYNFYDICFLVGPSLQYVDSSMTDVLSSMSLLIFRPYGVFFVDDGIFSLEMFFFEETGRASLFKILSTSTMDPSSLSLSYCKDGPKSTQTDTNTNTNTEEGSSI